MARRAKTRRAGTAAGLAVSAAAMVTGAVLATPLLANAAIEPLGPVAEGELCATASASVVCSPDAPPPDAPPPAPTSTAPTSTAPAPTSTAPAPSEPAPPATAGADVLLVSASSDRSDPAPLHAAALRRTGARYIFLQTSAVYAKVEFWIDNPGRTGEPAQVQLAPPWDLKGEFGSDAVPLRLSSMAAGEHTVTAVATTADGQETVTSATFSIGSAGDTIAPGKPTLVKVTEKTDTTATLTWRAADDTGGAGVVGYEVARLSPDKVTVSIQNVTTAVLTGLTPATEYTLVVRTRDGAGNVSLPSGVVTFRTLAAPKPTTSPTTSTTTTTQPPGPGSTDPQPGASLVLVDAAGAAGELDGARLGEGPARVRFAGAGAYVQVRFHLDDELAAVDPLLVELNAPFELTLPATLSSGAHTLTVIAQRADGSTVTITARFIR